MSLTYSRIYSLEARRVSRSLVLGLFLELSTYLLSLIVTGLSKMVLGRAGTSLRLTLASQNSLGSPRSTLPPPSTLPSPNSLASNENEASSRRYVTLVRQHLPKEVIKTRPAREAEDTPKDTAKDTAAARSS